MNSNRRMLSQAVIRQTWLAVMLGMVAWSVGCKSPTQISDVNVQVIDRDQLIELTGAQDKVVVLVDVRPERDYAADHIPGAIHIPLPQLHRNDPRLLAATEGIIVYGLGQQSHLSRVAAKKLQSLGYPLVYDFRGGLELWHNHAQAAP